MGGMRRHRETAEACLGELGGALDAGGRRRLGRVRPRGDAARSSPRRSRAKPTKAEFQEWFEAATDRWTGGEHDDEYAESFGAFTDAGRDQRCVVRRRGRGSRIARLHQRRPDRLGGRQPARRRAATSPARLWRRLNPVCVNSGVTRLVTGRRGTTLVTFNGHAHLDGVPDVLTYR